jgi:nitrate reductase alpha subunit
MAVALNEKLILYHVLHKELRQFHSYDHKNIAMLKFSSGGQTLWAADFKNIVVYSTFSLEKL